MKKIRLEMIREFGRKLEETGVGWEAYEEVRDFRSERYSKLFFLTNPSLEQTQELKVKRVVGGVSEAEEGSEEEEGEEIE